MAQDSFQDLGSSPEAPGAARRQFQYGPSKPSQKTPAAAVTVSTAGPALGAAFSTRDGIWFVAGGVVLLAAFSLLFGLNLLGLISVFIKDASWSHGFVVPLLSGLIVYLNYDRLKGLTPKHSGLGLLILIYGVATHVMFQSHGQTHMSNLSMLVVLFGAILFVLGWDYMRVLWLPVAFLLFMIPPPTVLYVKLTTPLQNVAATLGTLCLPAFGVEAIRSGTTIFVRGSGPWDQLNVAEACSGIRMLVAFGALAVVLAYTTPRPIWQKLLLAVCAGPVAILCNSLRVTLTGVIHVYLGAKAAQGNSHEMLGFLMLVPAGLMQLGIAWLLDRIFVEDETPAVVVTNAAAERGAGGQP